jgi:hypothetical protein
MNYIEKMHEGRPKEELDAWLAHLKDIGITDEKIAEWDRRHQAVLKQFEDNGVSTTKDEE